MRRFGIFFGTAVILSAAAAAWGATGAPEVVARIPTGSQPCSEVGGLGYVWVGVGGTGQLARIDPATNTVTARVPVGPGPCGVAIGAGSVWVDGYGTSSVIRVDPAKLKVVKRIQLHDQVWDVDLRSRLGLGDRARARLRGADQPEDEPRPAPVPDPGTASPANLRFGARRGLGRRAERPPDLPHRHAHRPGELDPRRARRRARSPSRRPRSGSRTSAAGTVSRVNPRTRKVVATIRVDGASGEPGRRRRRHGLRPVRRDEHARRGSTAPRTR